MLKAINLSKTYKAKKIQIKALDHVSVDFGDRGMVFVLGKSGSGKSTLLNLLGGLDKPTSGEIIIDGRSSAEFQERDFDAYRNTYIGFVFQEYNLIENYTVGTNISLALELQGKKTNKQAVDDILRKMQLVDENGETLYARRINELSGGQKQRVAIARALIKDPKIILADEPTGALDSETGKQLYKLLKELSKERLVIVVSHDRESAQTYGDRIIELADGKVVSDCAQSIENTEEVKKSQQFIKSHLPFKRSLIMGASAIKYKKVRLAFSILLSIFTFVAFGFSIVAGLADEFTTELKTLYDNGIKMISVENSSELITDNEFNGHRPPHYDTPLEFSEKQLEAIHSYKNGAIFSASAGFEDIGKYTDLYHGNDDEYLQQRAEMWNANPYLRLCLDSLRCGVQLDPNTGENDANLKPDGRFRDKTLCRLPRTNEEVAISDLSADMFIRYGFRQSDGTVVQIDAPDDLIGEKIEDLTICGVYSTEIDREYLEKFDIDGFYLYDDNYLNSYISSLDGEMLISRYYLCKGFAANDGFNSFIIKLSGNIKQDRAFFSKLNDSYTEAGDKDSGVIEYHYHYSVFIRSPYSTIVGEAFLYKNYVFKYAMIAIGILTVFSILLTSNFVIVSMDSKKKEIGILRALGANKKDVTLILLAESLTIAAINFFISLILVIILCVSLNIYLKLSVYIVGILPILFLFLLCFVSSGLATIIPAIKITKKKPIDIINNK